MKIGILFLIINTFTIKLENNEMKIRSNTIVENADGIYETHYITNL